MQRREFLQQTGTIATGTLLSNSLFANNNLLPGVNKKKRIAMVGTGHRGLQMWGIPVAKEYGDVIEFVGLCDTNAGRVDTAKKMMKAAETMLPHRYKPFCPRNI